MAVDGFKVEGFELLGRELKKLGKDAPKVGRAGIRAAAVEVRKEAQANLAENKDTGRLSDSLKVNAKVEGGRGRVVATIRTTRDTFYGLFLEYGSVNVAATKWFSSALRGVGRRAIQKNMVERMQKRIKAIKKKRGL